MSELYLLRHCKSDWNGSLSRDSDRSLSGRGLADANKLGQWMKENQYIPGYILCSTAVRARQTTQLMCNQLAFDENRIQYLPTLYLASLATLLSTIEASRDKSEPLLIVAHNPGMDELVNYLASQATPLTDQRKLMTTGCLARFSLPAVGQDLEHQAELLSITRPSEI